MLLNRKGHIGTTLLVFAALILVVVTLFGFVSFSDEVGNTKNEIRAIHSEFRYEERFNLGALSVFILESIKDSKDEVYFKDIFREELILFANSELEKQDRENAKTNLYAKLVNEDFSLSDDGGNYILFIEGVFYRQETKRVVMKSVFDLRIKFDKEKIVNFEKIYKLN